MKITHRNMVLRSIDPDDLELIRCWRNDNRVNEYLVQRDFISKQEQIRWFKSIDFMKSMYFIIEFETKSIGLVYVNEINTVNLSFNGNIFIGDHAMTNSVAPVKAVILLFELMFHQLSFNIVFSTVHKNNTPAIQMNQRMGFRTFKTQGDFVVQRSNKEDFNQSMQRIRSSVIGRESISFNFSEFDYNHTFLMLTRTNEMNQ